MAHRIKDLLQNGSVLDKAAGTYRAPEYRDMVILIRSIKGWADIFSTILAEEGIPAYAGSREGYFETYEVSVLLDYLKILDNFMQELPLTAVLTSPFVGLNAAQLADIRNAYPDVPFYEAVEKYAAAEIREGKLQGILKEFLETFRSFREMVPYTAIHDLLWHIIEDTGYGTFIAAMPGGAQRTANVEMLVEKAKDYIRNNYGDNELTIQKVADYLHISPSYLSMIFKKEAKVTFLKYLVKIRLEVAKELLGRTEMKTFQIAERIGYPEINYFSYFFKKNFGMSPREYRNQFLQKREQ